MKAVLVYAEPLLIQQAKQSQFSTRTSSTRVHTAELLTPEPRTGDGGGISKTFLLGAKGRRGRWLRSKLKGGGPANRKCSYPSVFVQDLYFKSPLPGFSLSGRHSPDAL
jgi:hypothetical protein